MKKVLVSTYCTPSSYGSILQAYALRTTLLNLNYSSFVLTETDKKRKQNKASLIQRAKRLLKNALLALRRLKSSQRYKKNMEFIRQYLDVIYYKSADEINKMALSADVYLAGSDQIFHPDLCRPSFFLDFAPRDAKKISYAASMGSTKIPDEKLEEFCRLLGNFDVLSFREQDAADLVKKMIKKDTFVHIDPTFLIEAEKWRAMEKEYPITGDYILVYAIYWNESLNMELKNLHNRTRMPIFVVSEQLHIYHQKRIDNAGVQEFLWLIDHAKYVVTSSFHGVCLSIIFQKELSVIVDPNQPSRIMNLMSLFGITPPDQRGIGCWIKNYSIIEEKIKKEKSRSIRYLEEMLRS